MNQDVEGDQTENQTKQKKTYKYYKTRLGVSNMISRLDQVTTEKIYYVIRKQSLDKKKRPWLVIVLHTELVYTSTAVNFAK